MIEERTMTAFLLGGLEAWRPVEIRLGQRSIEKLFKTTAYHSCSGSDPVINIHRGHIQVLLPNLNYMHNDVLLTQYIH